MDLKTQHWSTWLRSQKCAKTVGVANPGIGADMMMMMIMVMKSSVYEVNK